MQRRFDMLRAAQNSREETRLLTTPITDCVEHQTHSAGLSTVFRINYADGSEGFLKPFGFRTVNGIRRWYANVGSCSLHGHHPDETVLNEATAWQLAKRIGGPVAVVATPVVLMEIPGGGLGGAVSARRYGIKDNDRAVHRSRGHSLAAALFDALIAQQDRHSGNYRWNEPGWLFRLPAVMADLIRHSLPADPRRPQGLGLIDHGFCFARPGDFVRPDKRSLFVEWRHEQRLIDLTDPERAVLDSLLADSRLYGLADFLEPDRAQALAGRAELMRRRGTILDPGEW